jgi:hypothetical protein
VVVPAVVVGAAVVIGARAVTRHPPAVGRTSPDFRRRARRTRGTVTFTQAPARRWQTTAVPGAGHAPRIARTSPRLRILRLAALTRTRTHCRPVRWHATTVGRAAARAGDFSATAMEAAMPAAKTVAARAARTPRRTFSRVRHSRFLGAAIPAILAGPP